MTDSPLTVFLIDDDEGIRRSLQRALEKRGYAVESHASAASFLAVHDPARQGCLLLRAPQLLTTRVCYEIAVGHLLKSNRPGKSIRALARQHDMR